MASDSDNEQPEEEPEGVNLAEHETLPSVSMWAVRTLGSDEQSTCSFTCPACRKVVAKEDIRHNGPFYQTLIVEPVEEVSVPRKVYRDYRLCPFCGKARFYIGCKSVTPIPPSVVRKWNEAYGKKAV